MAEWRGSGEWTQRMNERNGANVAEPPGHLWFRMHAPDGSTRRVHSGLVSAKLQRGWTILDEYLENLADNSEFPS